jgi:ABC-2 type transport system permease protein
MGTLDYILTKPVNSQFFVSLRYIGVLNWSEPLMGLGLVFYALAQLGRVPQLGQITLFALLFVAGVVMLYSISLILQTPTIWLISIEQVDLLVQGVLETGRFPVSFFRGWVGALLTVIVPIAFMTTFPAQALLGRLDASLVIVAVLFAGVLFGVATWFWRFALRHYSGASS